MIARCGDGPKTALKVGKALEKRAPDWSVVADLKTRCHMKERIIALSSLAAGLAAFGLVAVIQTDPLAFTDGAPTVQVLEPPLSIPFPQLAPTWSEPPIESGPVTESFKVLELPPVFIVLSVQNPLQPVDERTLEPCSTWRELGPKYVSDGAPSGTQSVRDLC
jgi:hypothetical protein